MNDWSFWEYNSAISSFIPTCTEQMEEKLMVRLATLLELGNKSRPPTSKHLVGENGLFELLATANKCAWILKKMHVNSILLECTNSFQFINKVHDSIFSVRIAKGRQKLGLLRLIIPRYCKKITKVLIENQKIEKQALSIDFTSLFSELAL